MALKEPLPKSVEKVVQKMTGKENNIEISAAADITEEDTFGERWLVVTKEKLMVFSNDCQEASLLREIPLKEIAAVKAEQLVGNGILEVTANGETLQVIRYSNAEARKFARVAKNLEALIKNEKPPEEGEEEPIKRCKNCGRLLPEWSEVCPACVKKGKVLRRLLSYAKPYWPSASIVAALMLLGTAIDLAPPYLNKMLIDDVILSKTVLLKQKVFLLALLVLGMAGIRIAGSAIGIIRGRIAAWLGGRLTLDLRGELYQALQRLSLSYYDKRQTGNIIARVTQDAQELQWFIIDGLHYFVVEVLLLLGIGTMLFVMNWRLALLVLVPVPLVVGLSLVFWRRIFHAFHRYWHRRSRLYAILSDVLSGIKVVRAFAQEEKEIRRFDEKNVELFNSIVYAERLFATFFPALSFLTSAGALIVWYVGGLQVLGVFGKPITLGTLMAFFMYLGMFYGPLQFLSRVTDWLSHCLTAAERIFETLDAESEVKDAPDAIAMPNIRGEVVFKNVTFGYDKFKPVLHNINLEVKPGEMIGLVGHSGAGKSTMINLVCRFYDTNEGNIFIDGVDIRKIRQKDLRQQIGVVLQDTFLFSGTIAENIAYAKPGATREEIMQAAKIANAHDFIMKFPDGYDTQVGERGQRLSAGERQRISIARAILHNPKILILDEATASVDTETERQIQEAIARLVQNRTTFAIAHRLSTLRNADRLFVLENGKNVELGTHSELIAKKGVYWKLVQLQRDLSKIKAVDG